MNLKRITGTGAFILLMLAACEPLANREQSDQGALARSAAINSISFDCAAQTDGYQLIEENYFYRLWMGPEVTGGRTFLLTSDTMQCPLRFSALSDSTFRPAPNRTVQPNMQVGPAFVIPDSAADAAFILQGNDLDSELSHPSRQRCYFPPRIEATIQTPAERALYIRNTQVTLAFDPIELLGEFGVGVVVMCGNVYFGQERIL